MSALQDAANFQTSGRSYLAKYPGQAGASVRAITEEVMGRLAEAAAAEAEGEQPEPKTAASA